MIYKMAPNSLNIALKQKKIKNCFVIKKNLDMCLKKQVGNQKCDFYKKVLQICMKRKTKIFMSGP
jgi:hypothetical protein